MPRNKLDPAVGKPLVRDACEHLMVVKLVVEGLLVSRNRCLTNFCWHITAWMLGLGLFPGHHWRGERQRARRAYRPRHCRGQSFRAGSPAARRSGAQARASMTSTPSPAL